MCIYHVGYARRLTHLRCSRLFGFQLAAMIHARVFEASDVGNDFIAPGIRKLRNRIICLIHSTSAAHPYFFGNNGRYTYDIEDKGRTINKKGVSRPRSNVPALRARYQSGRARLIKRRRSQLAPAVRGALG
jgi:hypothetical protein